MIRTIKQSQSKYHLANLIHRSRIILVQLVVLELLKIPKTKNRVITIKVVLDLAFKANHLEHLIQTISRRSSLKDLDLEPMILQGDLIISHNLSLDLEAQIMDLEAQIMDLGVQIMDLINNSKMDLTNLIMEEEALIHLAVEEDEAVVEAEEEEVDSIAIIIMIALEMEDFTTI